MTLAEIFLLLLFLIWLSDVAKTSKNGATTDPNVLSIENARLKNENERLKAESQQLASEVTRLALIVDAFRKAIGIPVPIESPEQVPPAVKAAADAAKRGAPKCNDQNVFARISVLDGSTTLVVVAPQAVAEKVFGPPSADIPVGRVLIDSAEIDRVLEAVSRYASPNACRFDYTLTYRTPSDYYEGRERFERGSLFYLAARTTG